MWTIVHLYLQEMLREDVQDMIEDSWVWKVDEHQQRLSRRRETQRKSNVFQTMKAHSEGHFHLCRRNLGSFKWDSHHWTQDSLSLLYTLYILFFVGLCKHKKVLKQFLDAQLYTLSRSYLRDEKWKCLSQHVGILSQTNATDHVNATADTWRQERSLTANSIRK